MYDRTLYNGEKSAVSTSIEKVIAETPSSYFDKWWNDVYVTSVRFNTDEEFAALSDNDLETLKNDWLNAYLGHFLVQVLHDLGISTTGKSKSNSKMIKEIRELIKEALRNRISGTQTVTPVTISLPKTMDVYNLYILLGNVKTTLEQENYKYQEMIEMLVGNESNEAAKRNLDISTNAVESNNTKIKLIQNIQAQVEPFLDEILNSPA